MTIDVNLIAHTLEALIERWRYEARRLDRAVLVTRAVNISKEARMQAGVYRECADDLERIVETYKDFPPEPESA